MKLFLYAVLFTVSLLSSSILPYINAEPEPYDVFIKKYQPLLDKAKNEKLSPRKQFEIGIAMPDTICFDNKIRLLKLSDPHLVACVNQQSAIKLVEREWGILEQEPTLEETGHGTECINSFIIKFANADPASATLIKTFRLVFMKISSTLLWLPIAISHQDSSIVISSNGIFSEDEQRLIKTDLEKLGPLLSIDYSYGPCL